MTPKRLVAVCGAVLLLGLLGIAWSRGGGEYSDGEQAVANVARLKPGMSLASVIRTLHPKRVDVGRGFSYTTTVRDPKTYETFHALTPTRYLLLTSTPTPTTVATPTGRVPRTTESLRSWVLRDGAPPREDITLGRVLKVGSLQFQY